MAKSNITMEQLLAAQQSRPQTFHTGQEVEGKVISKTNFEAILDLGGKSDGVLLARELPRQHFDSLKIGDIIKAYVADIERESGQISLSSSPVVSSKTKFSSRTKQPPSWHKFILARDQKAALEGRVMEANKGGLIVEVDNTRGFLPNSQIGFELIKKAGTQVLSLVGQSVGIVVAEVDSRENKLIFTQKGLVSQLVKEKINSYTQGQKVTGKVVAILPFGLFVDLGEVGGLVFISDVSWDKVDDLSKQFAEGQEVEAVVIGKDENLGRLSLSIKELLQDPFAKVFETLKEDDVVKGEVVSVGESGVAVRMENPNREQGGFVEGFIPASKLEGVVYEPGQPVTVIIDNIDKSRRRINLAPFLTTTKGLIYK